jgi:hypothetical protein
MIPMRNVPELEAGLDGAGLETGGDVLGTEVGEMGAELGGELVVTAGGELGAELGLELHPITPTITRIKQIITKPTRGSSLDMFLLLKFIR